VLCASFSSNLRDIGVDPERVALRPQWEKNHTNWNFDVRKGPISVEWFKGGITNMCYNALDRHVKAGKGAWDKDRTAGVGVELGGTAATRGLPVHLNLHSWVVVCKFEGVLRLACSPASLLSSQSGPLPPCATPGDTLCLLWEGNDVGEDSRMTYKEVNRTGAGLLCVCDGRRVGWRQMFGGGEGLLQ